LQGFELPRPEAFRNIREEREVQALFGDLEKATV
jgi:hypothetical protein